MVLPVGDVWGMLWPFHGGIHSIELKFLRYVFACNANRQVTVSSVVLPRGQQFKVEREDNGAYVTDLEGFGTLVNDIRLRVGGKVLLNHADRVSIKSSSFMVFIFLASGVPDPFPFVREIKERYALASFLGRGSFGDVILAFDKISCQKLAIKRIKTTPGEGNLELNVLKTIDHPCVLRLLDHVLTPDDTFLVLQFCEGGPLSGVVFPKRTLNELEVKTVFYQLTLALQYLHDIGIVHRDIKLDNILLFSKEPETLIKLIDFGASNCSGSLALGTPIGSSLYVAPEVLRASLVGSTYCHQADVWSAGVVLFLCLGGYQPFLDHESILNGDFNLEPSIWDKVSPPARDLVQRMLEVDPRLRVSIKHILRHKWMKDSRLKSKLHSLMKAEIKHWRECSISSSLRERKKRCITTPTIEQPGAYFKRQYRSQPPIKQSVGRSLPDITAIYSLTDKNAIKFQCHHTNQKMENLQKHQSHVIENSPVKEKHNGHPYSSNLKYSYSSNNFLETTYINSHNVDTECNNSKKMFGYARNDKAMPFEDVKPPNSYSYTCQTIRPNVLVKKEKCKIKVFGYEIVKR